MQKTVWWEPDPAAGGHLGRTYERVRAVYKKAGFILTVIILVAGIAGAGCQPGNEEIDVETETEEERDEQVEYIQSEGIFVGQIDSQSVEIEVAGQPRAFALSEGIDVSGIGSGSRVSFTYDDRGERPLLQSIEVTDKPSDEVIQSEGTYVGRIDSRSVEIEINGEYRAFTIDREATVEDLIDGSIIAFTYRETDSRPVLMSVEIIEEPDPGQDGETIEVKGEGIYIGQIDSRSVEIFRSRAFTLGRGVSVNNIADGSKVAFTYTETRERATLKQIEAVDSPPEGEVIPGTYNGRIDSHSVEIEYDQAFTLGEEVDVESIAEGSEIVFTYRTGPARPVLVSISER